MFNKKLITTCILLLSTLAQVGCETYSIRNRSDDYLAAKTTAPLKTPKGVKAIETKTEYDIPKTSTDGLKAEDALVPPDLR